MEHAITDATASPTVVTVTPPLDADDTLVCLDSRRRRYAMRAAGIVGLVVYTAYLAYRIAFTINPEALVFSLLVLFAEVHGFFSLAFYFHSLWTVRSRRVPAPAPNVPVDVFVTTYNEDIDMLRQTLRAAVNMRCPHRTYVLDDGRRPEVRALAEEVGCHYITRPDNRDAKAGNWNNAFAQTSGTLIATFDADHVPRPDFLERTLGFFRDPKVALVQVPQVYHNLDSVQHRVNWKTRRMYGEQDAFFNLVMPGKDHWNAAFFCGTGAVLRRAALAPHGGILTGTITEDLHTSIVLHSEGWKSVYLNELLVTGLAPLDLKSFEVQRLRWAEGNLKVGTLANPLTTPGLTLAQRITYAASLYHWTIGIPKAIFYCAPPWILFTGTFPIARFDATFVAIYLAFLSTLIASYEIVSRGKGRLLLGELFNMASFFTFVRAVKRVIIGRGKPSRFVVTSKRGSGQRDYGAVLPHLVLVYFSCFAITWSLLGLGFGVTEDWFGAGTAIFWTLYNMTLMVVVIGIGSRPAEKRTNPRFRASFAVEARDRTGTLGVTADIAEQGCSLLWPEPLEVGIRFPIRIHFGASSADWTGQVVSDQGRQEDGWHRYGVQFVDLSQDDVDQMNDSIFAVVVPDLFLTLTEPGLVYRLARRVALRLSKRARIRSARQAVRVPGRLYAPSGSFVITGRDTSRTGLGALVPVRIEPGTEVVLAMQTPTRVWHGRATVVRCVSRPSRQGLETWLVGLELTRRDGEEPVDALWSDAA